MVFPGSIYAAPTHNMGDISTGKPKFDPVEIGRHMAEWMRVDSERLKVHVDLEDPIPLQFYFLVAGADDPEFDHAISVFRHLWEESYSVFAWAQVTKPHWAFSSDG